MLRSGDFCVHDDNNDNNNDNDDRTDHFTLAHVRGVISGINYHPCSKGCHGLYVIINTGLKIDGMGAIEGGNFLQAKISSYMYVVYYFAYRALNCECFVSKIFLESLAYVKIKRKKT